MHAVTDERLRELMNLMDSLMLERFVTEPEQDRQNRKVAAQMVAAAEELGKSVDAILARLPSLELNENEQTTFRALAGKLRGQASELRELATNNRIDAIPESLDRVNTTCMACHGLFRNLKGKGN